MNIALKPQAKKILKRLVAEGQYASESEALNAAVFQMDDGSVDWDWVARAVAEGEDAYKRGAYIEVDKKGLKKLGSDIRRRARARLRKRT